MVREFTGRLPRRLVLELPEKGQPVDADAYPFDYPNSGFGRYCERLCAPPAEREGTFAASRNLEG